MTAIDLVTVENGEPVTTSLAIAEGVGNEHASVIKMARQYQSDLEEFGTCRFEIAKSAGRSTEYAVLNERQATLLISYMRNSEIVREFKIRLVKRFYEMAEELKRVQVQQSAPQSRAAELTEVLTIAYRAILNVPGVKPDIAAANFLTAVAKNTGVDTADLRLSLPATVKKQPTLNATKVGQLLGMTAREANFVLAASGFQQRNDRGEWEITEKGAHYGAMYPFSRNGRSGYQALWLEEVVEVLRLIEH